MERTVTIQDTLQEHVDTAIMEVRDLAAIWVKENPDATECDISDDLDYSGGVHEIIDSNVPIYTSEIDDTWYLHGRKCEQAYDDAGLGIEKNNSDHPSGDWRMAAIYCYIEQDVHTWWFAEGQEAVSYLLDPDKEPVTA